MAFVARNLHRYESVVYASNSSVRFYKYATTDAKATVLAAGYFNDARDFLKVNDVIDAVVGIGGTPLVITMRVTAVPATGNVTTVLTQDDATAA